MEQSLAVTELMHEQSNMDLLQNADPGQRRQSNPDGFPEIG